MTSKNNGVSLIEKSREKRREWGEGGGTERRSYFMKSHSDNVLEMDQTGGSGVTMRLLH